MLSSTIRFLYDRRIFVGYKQIDFFIVNIYRDAMSFHYLISDDELDITTTPILMLPIEILFHYFITCAGGLRKKDIQSFLAATGLRYYYAIRNFMIIVPDLDRSVYLEYYMNHSLTLKKFKKSLTLKRISLDDLPENQISAQMSQYEQQLEKIYIFGRIKLLTPMFPNKARKRFPKCCICKERKRRRDYSIMSTMICGCVIHYNCRMHDPVTIHNDECPWYQSYALRQIQSSFFI